MYMIFNLKKVKFTVLFATVGIGSWSQSQNFIKTGARGETNSFVSATLQESDQPGKVRNNLQIAESDQPD
jgi:hypothetical protein